MPVVSTSAGMDAPEYFPMPDGRRIAYRFAEGDGPALVFLPGYMSDMEGGKASAVFEWARREGRACLLLDYSGCGQSAGEFGGDFAEGTLGRWRDEVLALVAALIDGPVVLVGSSMGGWLMLLVGLKLDERLAGMVGIAAAPDFSDWAYDQAQKDRLAAGETVHEDNPYGPEPTPTYAKFWRDAEERKLLANPVAIDCPVRLLHGQRDTDVPWRVSLELAEALRSDDVQVMLIKHADHRMSRDCDIALLLRIIAALPHGSRY